MADLIFPFLLGTAFGYVIGMAVTYMTVKFMAGRNPLVTEDPLDSHLRDYRGGVDLKMESYNVNMDDIEYMEASEGMTTIKYKENKK